MDPSPEKSVDSEIHSRLGNPDSSKIDVPQAWQLMPLILVLAILLGPQVEAKEKGGSRIRSEDSEKYRSSTFFNWLQHLSIATKKQGVQHQSTRLFASLQIGEHLGAGSFGCVFEVTKRGKCEKDSHPLA